MANQYTLTLDKGFEKAQGFYSTVNDFVDCDPEKLISSKYITKYLIERTNEAAEASIYQNRLERSYPITISESVLVQHHAPSAQPVLIEGYDDEEVLGDVTGYGQPAEEFFADQLFAHYKHGLHGVLVEMPTDVGETLAENRERGARPYFTLYEADQIVKIQLFHFGPKRGKVAEVVLTEAPGTNSQGEEIERLRRYFVNGATYTMQLLEARKSKVKNLREEQQTYDIIEQLDGPFEEIPFVPMGLGRKESVLRRVYPIDKGLLNLLSVRTNINFNQGFRKTIVAGVGDMDDTNLDKIGEYVVNFISNPDAKVWEVAAGDPKAVAEEIRFVIRWGVDIGLMRFNQLMDDTRQVQSVDSKVKDLIVRTKFYDQTLNRFQRKLAQAYRFAAMFQGEQPDIQVKIARDYALDDTELELQRDRFVFQAAGSLPTAGPEVQKALIKKYVAEMKLVPGEGKSEEEVRKELMAAIDADTGKRAVEERQRPGLREVLSGGRDA